MVGGEINPENTRRKVCAGNLPRFLYTDKLWLYILDYLDVSFNLCLIAYLFILL